jgi:two-component system NtrC family sensor kinase
VSTEKGITPAEPVALDEHHYRVMKRRQLFRLTVLYLGPLVLLATYFFLQYDAIVSESQRLHLRAIAESQANTLDLFLFERLVNLTNAVDDNHLAVPPTTDQMVERLDRLRRNSDTFVDFGFFDSLGVLSVYAGPFPSLEYRSYSDENWYRRLLASPDQFVITDIYLGFRRAPHFTIAISRRLNDQVVVYRATIDPHKMYEYVSSLGSAEEVYSSVVNREGKFQLANPAEGKPLDDARFVPPDSPRTGVVVVRVEDRQVPYAYAWLSSVDWGLTVRISQVESGSLFSGFRLRVIGIAVVMLLVGSVILFHRAGKMVQAQIEADRTRTQLSHAAKLASVGELAAGIAHEINNPLAAINEEAGLTKDLLSRQYGKTIGTDDVIAALDSIQGLVFRCRDITHKLLGFVRKDDIDLREHDIHKLLDEVVDGLLGHELSVSNVTLVKMYDHSIPAILTDRNQLEQVFLNLIKNAQDAIGDRCGTIIVTTRRQNRDICIEIADTGKGMSPQQLEMIFIPFYTTKEVGQGTGLGLSVSYGIVRGLHGQIDATSTVGAGTTFTIRLPLQSPDVRAG